MRHADLPPDPPLDLHPLLDGLTPDASPDALRSIVERHRRRRTRLLGVSLAIALVAGPAFGYLMSRAGDSDVSVAAGSPDGGSLYLSSPYGRLRALSTSSPTQLFLRNSSDGTRVRAYVADDSTPGDCVDAIVGVGVSNDQVAGDVEKLAPSRSTSRADPFAWDRKLEVVGRDVVGVGQPRPILTAVFRVADNVASVSLRLASGQTDTMAPVDGWAVLALTIDPAEVAKAQPQPPSNTWMRTGNEQDIKSEAFDAQGNSLGISGFDLASAVGGDPPGGVPDECRSDPRSEAVDAVGATTVPTTTLQAPAPPPTTGG